MDIEKKPNRIVMLPTNGAGDVDYAYIEYDLQSIEAVERQGFELIEGWDFKPFSLVPAQQSPAVAVPDEYLLLAQLELVSRSLKNKDLSVMSNAVNKAIAIIQSPRITEQDAREQVLLEAIFKIEKKYFRTIHDHGATENAQIVLAELRGMIGLPMILKRDLPEWDGVAYVIPPASNLVANQPDLLKKLNNNPTT